MEKLTVNSIGQKSPCPLWNMKIHYCVHKCLWSLRPNVTFHNMLIFYGFYGERLLALPNPQAKVHPLLVSAPAYSTHLQLPTCGGGLLHQQPEATLCHGHKTHFPSLKSYAHIDCTNVYLKSVSFLFMWNVLYFCCMTTVHMGWTTLW
jgi:hypothetical protein